MVMPGLALICSLALLFQHRARLFPIIALVGSGLEFLMSFGIVHVNAGTLPITLILGACVCVGGIGVYVKASAKPIVSAATVLTLIGLVQVLGALHMRIL